MIWFFHVIIYANIIIIHWYVVPLVTCRFRNRIFVYLTDKTPQLTKGPSIKYVTLCLANFYPLPCHICHTPRDPPESTSHISDPPNF